MLVNDILLWIAFNACIFVMLFLDLGIFHRRIVLLSLERHSYGARLGSKTILLEEKQLSNVTILAKFISFRFLKTECD